MLDLTILSTDTTETTDVTTAVPNRYLLTVEEAADLLGVGRTLMYALVSAGEVESVTIGRLRRVPTDAIAVYVAALRRRSTEVAA